MKKSKKTIIKIVIILLILFALLTGIYCLYKRENIKADVPYSLQKTLYAYTSDVDADPEYEVKIVIFPHPDRLNTESYVEYYLDGVLVKSEKIR